MKEQATGKEIVGKTHVQPGLYSAREMEQLVVLERRALYNQGQPCGAKALRKHINTYLDVTSLPSERAIGRILARHGLTRGRTGWYEGDTPP